MAANENFNGSVIISKPLHSTNELSVSRLYTSVRIKPIVDESRLRGIQTKVNRSSSEQRVCVSALEGCQRVECVRDLYDKRVFKLDKVFERSSTNETVYSGSSLKSIVNDVVKNGYNGCALAYGQTGYDLCNTSNFDFVCNCI